MARRLEPGDDGPEEGCMTKLLTKKQARIVAGRAKAKADARNKAGAIIRDLDKPDGPYTKVITCIDCSKPRKVKPQDAWQVKRCVDCQNTKKIGKLRVLQQQKASPDHQREERRRRALARLDDYVRRNEEDLAANRAFHKRLAKEHAERPRLKRIWPR
jgi:hypothetical protein